MAGRRGGAGPFGTGDGGLPDPVRQAGRGRVQQGAARQRLAAQGLLQEPGGPFLVLPALLEVAPEGLEGRAVGAAPDAEFDPAAAEQVGQGGVLGDPERVVQRQRRHRGTEPDPVGPCGHCGEVDERGGDDAALRTQVVLGDPEGVEAEVLGDHGEPEVFAEDPAGIAGAGHVEQHAEPLRAGRPRAGPVGRGGSGRGGAGHRVSSPAGPPESVCTTSPVTCCGSRSRW